MAAALHAKIMAEGYTPGMLRAAFKGQMQTASVPVFVDHLRPRTVVPQRFVAPRPERGPESFAKILHWREEEGGSPHAIGSANGYREHEYTCSGGILVSRVLTKCWEMARAIKDDVHQRTMNDPGFEAPQWPSETELVFNPPQWGSNTTFDPFCDEEVVYPHHRVAPQPTTGCGLSSRTTVGHIQDSGPTSATYPGFFVGRDGSRWPLPPPECMPSSTAPTRPPGLPSPPRGHRALPPRVASSDRSESAQSRPSPRSSPLLPDSPSTSTSTHLTTPEQSPESVPEPVPSVGVIGDGRPKPTKPHVVGRTEGAASPVGGWTNALRIDLGSRRPQREDSRASPPDMGPGGFFQGSDGSLWPLPPSLEELLACVGRVRRGRNPVPKW